MCGDWLFVGWKARLLASGRVDHVAAEQCDLAGFLLRVRPRRPRSRAPRNELPPSHPVIFLAVGTAYRGPQSPTNSRDHPFQDIAQDDSRAGA